MDIGLVDVGHLEKVIVGSTEIIGLCDAILTEIEGFSIFFYPKNIGQTAICQVELGFIIGMETVNVSLCQANFLMFFRKAVLVAIDKVDRQVLVFFGHPQANS